MSFSFPYQYGFLNNKEKIVYPIVPIRLQTIRGNRFFSFIFDSGADTLTMPNYMLILLNVNKDTLIQSQYQGIGNNPVSVWEGKIPVYFCKRTFNVKCTFTDNDRTPLLLGKEGIFDKFNIIFDNIHKRTVFENIS